MERESNWLWLVYLPYLALLGGIGFSHSHAKNVAAYLIIFLIAAFLITPLFKLFWAFDRRRRTPLMRKERHTANNLSQTGTERGEN